jgi:hypothetical protein
VQFFRPHLCWLLILGGFTLAGGRSTAAPAPTEWKDAKGATFRGTPVETLAGFALFRTGAASSRFMPMRSLAPQDCVRFYQAIADRPARAEHWSEARGEMSKELIGRLLESHNHKVQPLDYRRVPEPELVLACLIGRRIQDGTPTHLILDNLAPFVNRIHRVYPGRVATVIAASRESKIEARNLPSAGSWLVVDPKKIFDLNLLPRLIPSEGIVLLLLTREGVPLLGLPANDVMEVMKFVDGASEVLWQLNPANPRTARDRLHYQRAVRPVQFAGGQSGPLLILDALRVDALRQRGIKRIAARLEVAADGTVAALELLPASEIPAPLAPAVGEAVRRNAVFLPAIDHGAPVAGAFDYDLKVEELDPKLAADAAWLNGEARVDLPFKQWLALKPIKVPEQVFSTIDRVGEDGTVMLKAVTAGSGKVSNASQMNAFNSDWFGTAGPASVQPVAGAKQEVDGEVLTWKAIKPREGLVDFLGSGSYGSMDYCVGYAWTEFEVADDMDGWLGIGSDDGLRIWLNGEEINDKWIARTSRLDDDVVPLRLKKGKNALLIKIQNVKGLWSFTCRLRVRGS